MSEITQLRQKVVQLTNIVNQILVNAKKTEQFPELTEFLGEAALRVSVDGVSQHLTLQKLSQLILTKTDALISIDTITIEDQVLLIPANGIWRFGGQMYSNALPFTQEIEYADEGMTRFDLVVANTSNSFEIIRGQETAGSPFVPPVPNGTLYVTHFLVSEDSVGEVAPPELDLNYYRDSKVLDVYVEDVLEETSLDDLIGEDVYFWYDTQTTLSPNTLHLVRVYDLDGNFDTYSINTAEENCEVVAKYRGEGSGGLTPSAEIEIQYATYPDFVGMTLYDISWGNIDSFMYTYYPTILDEVSMVNVKVIHSIDSNDKFKQFQVFKDQYGTQKVVEITTVLDKAEYLTSGDYYIAYPYQVEAVNGRLIDAMYGFSLSINPSIDCRFKLLFSQAGDLTIGEDVVVNGDISGTDTTIAIEEGSFFEVFSLNGYWCFKRIGGASLTSGYEYELLAEFPPSEEFEPGQAYVNDAGSEEFIIHLSPITKKGDDISDYIRGLKKGDIFKFKDRLGQVVSMNLLSPPYYSEYGSWVLIGTQLPSNKFWVATNFEDFEWDNTSCVVDFDTVYTPESNDIVTINEEFATAPALNGVPLNSGTPSPAAASYIDANHFGCYQINKGSNDNAGFGYGTPLGSLQVANGLKFYDIVRTTTLTSVFWQGGFMNVQANASSPAIPSPTQGAYYEMNDGVIIFKLISGAFTTTAPTSFTMSANTWYLIYLEVKDDSVRFELRDMSGDVLYSWYPSASSAVPMGQKLSAQVQFFCTTNSTAPPQVAIIDKFKVVTPEMGRNLPF